MLKSILFYSLSFMLGGIQVLTLDNHITHIPFIGIFSFLFFITMNKTSSKKEFSLSLLLFYLGFYFLFGHTTFFPFFKKEYGMLFSITLGLGSTLLVQTSFLINSIIIKYCTLSHIKKLIIVSLVDYFLIGLFNFHIPMNFASIIQYMNGVFYFGYFYLVILSYSLFFGLLYRKKTFVYLFILLSLFNFIPLEKDKEFKTITVTHITGKKYDDSFFNILKNKNISSDLIVLPENSLNEKEIRSIKVKEGQVVVGGLTNEKYYIKTKDNLRINKKRFPFPIIESFSWKQYYKRFKNFDAENCILKPYKICVFVCWEALFPAYYMQYRYYDILINPGGGTLLGEMMKEHQLEATRITSKATNSYLIYNYTDAYNSLIQRGKLAFKIYSKHEKMINYSIKIPITKSPQFVFSFFDFWFIFIFILLFGEKYYLRVISND